MSFHEPGEDLAIFDLGQNAGPARLLNQDPQRDEKGGDENHILNLLIAGDTGHTGNKHVSKGDAGGKKNAGGIIHAENPAADQADSLELGGGIGDSDNDRDGCGDHPYRVAVVPVPEKFGDGKFAEAAYLRCEQGEQQYIPSSPADDIAQSEPSLQIKQPGNAHEGSGRHPVRGNRGAIAKFTDSLSGYPVAGGAGYL